MGRTMLPEIEVYTNPEQVLVQDMARLSKDPMAWVMYSFPWGKGELEKFEGPEPWQEEVLCAIRDGLIDVSEAVRIAAASGHGVGKSSLVAWIILWSLSTMEDTRGVVTANTENQLRTKTWPELTKWHNIFIAKDWFVMTATAVYSSSPGHDRTWRFDMLPWSENKTESFAGLHNQGRRVVLIFDEASSIPDVIWEVSEGALTDSDTEIIWAVFGNPTRNTGRFKECFGKYRHRWLTWRVDSRKISFTNKTLIDKWIKDYGEDSDFVKVRVRGDFPAQSDMQFIPVDIVDAARGRHLRTEQFDFAPVIIGVDPSWSGSAEGVIYLRQGLMSKKLMTFRGIKDDYIIAGHIARLEDEYKADAVFIDLGYGTGIFSAGKQMNRNWQLIPFGGLPADEGYLNKRAEMWGLMKQWLKDGGALEDDPVICDQLISVEGYNVQTGRNAGKIFLESKDDLKQRGLESPDRADALALTFSAPVLNKSQKQYDRLAKMSGGQKAYDPFALNGGQSSDSDYNPLSPLAGWKEN